MQWTHLKNADLNLLLALHLLLEERQVKSAADRFGLSPPAMSRVLQRLRYTFGDELIIRTRNGYSPTLRAQRIETELRDILSRIDMLLGEGNFDPGTAEVSFKIACSDFSTFIQGPSLSRLLNERAPKVSLEIVAFSDDAFPDAERGEIDLVLWVNDVPDPLVSETLFVEEYVCVLSKGHPAPRRPLTMDEYLKHPHIIVTILAGRQTVVDARIEKLGGKRRASLRVPYFAAAIAAVPHTNLIATVPKRIAAPHADNEAIEIVAAPAELEPIQYVMAWHPRLSDDPAHTWLRSIVLESAKEL